MADIISKDPISNEYVDRVIKANEILDENSANTQGVQLRQLVKDLRDRLETEVEKSNAAITGKVDAVAGKGLSTLDFTQADKDTIDNFNNWSDDIASKNYVDLKIEPLQSSIDNLNTTTNGIVKLLDAPFGKLFNNQSVNEFAYLRYEGSNGAQAYQINIPAEFYSDLNGKGFIRLKFFLKIVPKENGIVNVKTNFFGNGARGFGIVSETMLAFQEKEYLMELLVKRGIDGTEIFVLRNGQQILDQHSMTDDGTVEIEWEDFPKRIDYMMFSTSAGTGRADVTISGLTVEIASLTN
ncbi:hypothetical protein [Sphingobacterium detergens]